MASATSSYADRSDYCLGASVGYVTSASSVAHVARDRRQSRSSRRERRDGGGSVICGIARWARERGPASQTSGHTGCTRAQTRARRFDRDAQLFASHRPAASRGSALSCGACFCRPSTIVLCLGGRTLLDSRWTNHSHQKTRTLEAVLQTFSIETGAGHSDFDIRIDFREKQKSSVRHRSERVHQ